MHFALTTYNRIQFLRPSLESLSKSDFPFGSHMIVSDDCSDAEVKEYIRLSFDTRIENLTVKTIFNKINVGCDFNVVRVIRECFFDSGEDFVVVTDSDAIYNPKWIHKLLEAKSQITEKIGMLGVFNSSDHKTIGDYNDNIVRKSSLGGLAVMVNREVFMHPALIFRAWDLSYSYLCNRLGYGIFCTKNSYVEHIGTIGTHSKNGFQGSKASNFVP